MACRLTGCRLTGCLLMACRLTGCRLTGCRLTGCLSRLINGFSTYPMPGRRIVYCLQESKRFGCKTVNPR
ncbi:pentapeptide repeat-containing protein [Enterococcus malodoratus]|uniref:pentapeptide repeat-containing protein n=1 Tax=Enterococcus malodoratus TaxID=71451 RepID=UPI003A522B2A